MDETVKFLLEAGAIMLFFMFIMEFSSWSAWIRKWAGRGLTAGAVWIGAHELFKMYKAEKTPGTILVPAENNKDTKE